MIGMRTAESILYRTLPLPSAPRQTIRLENSQEGFVLCADGEIRMILPGETYLPDPAGDRGIVTVQSSASVRCVAGAGMIPLDQNRFLDGWVSFSCRILSPRRFIVRCAEELACRRSAEDILSEYMRKYITAVSVRTGKAFSAVNSSCLRRMIRQEIRQDTENILLDIGWQLTKLKLEYLKIG